MEDSHITHTDIIPGVHVFAVFDGHGGNQVSAYVKDHFVPMLLENEEFQAKDYKNALINTFVKLDEELNSFTANQDLKQYTKVGENHYT